MIEALLEATRDRLIDQLALSNFEVGIQPDGRPPAVMGEFYISLDEQNIQSSEMGFLQERYAISIWFTLRAGIYANDRKDEPYLLQSKLLTAWERKIIKAIHGRQEIRQSANLLLAEYGATGSGEFSFPLYYGGRTKTRTPGEWILGETADPSPCMVRELAFNGGLRTQNLDTIA